MPHLVEVDVCPTGWTSDTLLRPGGDERVLQLVVNTDIQHVFEVFGTYKPQQVPSKRVV